MLRDLGRRPIWTRKPRRKRDYELVENADYVCLFNWTGTLRFGTELAQAVFERAKRSRRSKTYYDTADPTPKIKDLPVLIDKVLKTGKVDILGSVNENEAIIFASMLDLDLKEKKKDLGFAELAMEAARVLAKYLPARIDLHTTVFSAATLNSKKEVVVPAFKVKALRATGSGDAWCAGNVIGDHNGLSDECRLLLANAVSACYLQDSGGLHPTKKNS